MVRLRSLPILGYVPHISQGSVDESRLERNSQCGRLYLLIYECSIGRRDSLLAKKKGPDSRVWVLLPPTIGQTIIEPGIFETVL